MQIGSLFSLVKEAATEWVDDNASRLSAALAYYSIFSIAPLILIAIAIAGLVFGEEAARGQMAQEVRRLAGEQAGRAIETILKSAHHRGTGLVAATVGLVMLLFGASGVFGELKSALNTIWGVAIKPGRSVLLLIGDRLLSFGMVLGIGFLLLITLVLSATLSAFGRLLQSALVLPSVIWQGIDFIVSFAIVTVLFGAIFKILPNAKIRWRDVWVGATGTAFLFSIGKHLIGLYLGAGSIASAYGAAGSAIVVLLWVYYSACIMFLGAEFTKVYARKFGPGIVPSENAVLLVDAMTKNRVKRPRTNER